MVCNLPISDISKHDMSEWITQNHVRCCNTILQTSYIRRYTGWVKTGKIIHVLLIALLCYGQLVTSIHAVGHFETAVAQAPEHSVIDSGHLCFHSVESEAGRAVHSHAPATADADSESDCSVYHTYLNQGSVLAAPAHDVMAVLRQSTDSLYAFTSPAGAPVLNLPIRAPPIVP